MRRVWILAGVLAANASSACGSRQPASAMEPATAGTTGVTNRVDATEIATAEHRPDIPEGSVQGFVMTNAGELSGRVVDSDGRPIASAPVHLVAKHGERTVKTDRDGQFKTVVDEPTLVVVYGGAQVSGSAATTERIEGTEAIDVHGVLPPAEQAKPLSDPTIIPEYSTAILDRNAWARAWLLLDISANGVVTRVKLLDAPGYGLDAIAVRDAFELKFEPARNRVDQPMSSLVMWRFDWPPRVWNHGGRRVPARALKLPCRTDAKQAWYALDVPYRDCSPPNMAAAITAPWRIPPAK